MSNALEREKMQRALDNGDASHTKVDQGWFNKEPQPSKGTTTDDKPRLPIWRNSDGTYGGVISVPCDPHPTPLDATKLDFRPFARSGFLFLADSHQAPWPVGTEHFVGLPVPFPGNMTCDPVMFHDQVEHPMPWHKAGELPSGQSCERPCLWLTFKLLDEAPATKRLLERGYDKHYLAFASGFRDKLSGNVEVDRVGLFPLDGGK